MDGGEGAELVPWLPAWKMELIIYPKVCENMGIDIYPVAYSFPYNSKLRVPVQSALSLSLSHFGEASFPPR